MGMWEGIGERIRGEIVISHEQKGIGQHDGTKRSKEK